MFALLNTHTHRQHPHTHTHASICLSSSSLPPLLTLYTVAIPFGYSCSRPFQRARYMNVNPLSLSHSLSRSLFILFFILAVCVFCFSLLVAWLYQISLYPFISVAQYLYPAVYPFLVVCVVSRAGSACKNFKIAPSRCAMVEHQTSL